MNDQHPFDVAPEDEPRPATHAAQPGAAGSPASADGSATPADTLDEHETAAAAAADEHAVRRKHRRIAALSIAAAVIFTAGAGGGAAASLALARSTTTATADGGSTSQQGGASGTQNGFGGTQDGFGTWGGFGSRGQGTGTGTGSSGRAATAASSEQIAGLVTIVTQLGYENGEAAGTGIVLTADGRILTNNHVIDGATAIQVTDVSTGRSYTAKVVGTNATQDIAVLQLEGASGLTTADLATTSPSTGDDVTAVGNANGTGTLSAAEGTITALDQTITTSSEGSTSGETLHGLIEISADVVSGDSGGAVENSDGDVIGVTTAASSGTSDITGYAIPIDTAMSIASQIVAGDDTDQITIGLPAFLGVAIAADPSGSGSSSGSASGAVVGQVLPGTAAASTDLAAGDVITAVGGTTISSAEALSAAIATHQPGDRVQVVYTDSAGDAHTVTVTLTEGPAD